MRLFSSVFRKGTCAPVLGAQVRSLNGVVYLHIAPQSFLQLPCQRFLQTPNT
jgi:hypothetical protein